MLEKDSLSDQQVDDALLAARVDPQAKKAFRRGRLPCLAAVAAGHPLRRPHPRHHCQSNSLLAPREGLRRAPHVPRRNRLLRLRLRLRSYTDPAWKLAQAIRRETEAFIQKHQRGRGSS